MPSLHEHLQLTGGEDRPFSFEEVIAVRSRLTGDAMTDVLERAGLVRVIDWSKVAVYTAALARQGLRHGDLGPAFKVALTSVGGSVPAACERMIALFGRAPSRSYAAKIYRTWQEQSKQRRAEAIRQLHARGLLHPS
ncbi:hypothetical protein ACWENQ_40960 [Nonomuraea sp. NPDC004354]